MISYSPSTTTSSSSQLSPDGPRHEIDNPSISHPQAQHRVGIVGCLVGHQCRRDPFGAQVGHRIEKVVVLGIIIIVVVIVVVGIHHHHEQFGRRRGGPAVADVVVVAVVAVGGATRRSSDQRRR